MASTIPKGAKGSNQYRIRDGVTVDVGVIDRSRAGVGRSLAQALQSEVWETVRSHQFLERTQQTADRYLDDIERRQNPERPDRWWSRFTNRTRHPVTDRDVIDLRDPSRSTVNPERLDGLSDRELGARIVHNTTEITKIRDDHLVQRWDDQDKMWRDRYLDEFPTLDEHQRVQHQLLMLRDDTFACCDVLDRRREDRQ